VYNTHIKLVSRSDSRFSRFVGGKEQYGR